MKIYEKPMAIVNKFEVEDVIAASIYAANDATFVAVVDDTTYEGTTSQGVVFQW